MSLRERLNLLPTRSLYFAVFLAMVGTLSLSFLVFRQISVRLERKHFDPVYDRLDELQRICPFNLGHDRPVICLMDGDRVIGVRTGERGIDVAA